MLDIKKLLGDVGVPYWTSGKNVSDGWTSISCPMCGDRSNHGAFSPEGTKYSCFRCGKHSLVSVIATWVSWGEALSLIKEYSTTLFVPEGSGRERAASVIWPPENEVPMPSLHAEYLHSRGYDPKQLRELYDLRCVYQTGAFKYRIIIPVFVNGRIVTYIGRDVTDKSPLPYKNLAEVKSVLPAKEVVYNLDSVHETAIICEGVFDSWRFGIHGVAMFGLQYTSAQTRALAKHIKRGFIVFDEEEQAQAKAKELGAELAFQGVEVEIITNIGYNDPGEMPESAANLIKNELLGY